MRLNLIPLLFLISLLISSCRTGFVTSAGLSYDQGTLATDDRDFEKGPGAFIDVGLKRMVASEDRMTDIVHGFGINYQMHINGYAFHLEGERHIYNLFQAKAYWEVEAMSSDYISTDLYAGLGFGKQRTRSDEENFLFAPTVGLDIHFFKKEFIFISPKVSYLRNFSLPGNQLSVELGMGFYFK